MRAFSRALPLALALAGTACEPPPGSFALQLIVDGLDRPLYLTSPPNDRRLFIVEQTGAIQIVDGNFLRPDPFLDLSAEVSCCGERGLLSLAFHPNFAKNGRFFVNYTDANGDTVVSSFTVSDDPNRADPDSEQVILTQAQPFENHNGGLLKFGPDGFLYIAFGDGGSANDPLLAGRDLSTRLGKLLRIDVDGALPFEVPPDNPFVGQADALPEIWHLGLRNPWRFSFDRATGDLYLGDVGQNAFEEIDFAPAGQGGIDWGWSAMEGINHCVNEGGCEDIPGITLPLTEYGHDEGCSVTGGYVYRGAALPGLAGKYLYSDFCSGFLRSLTVEDGALVREEDLTADFGIRDAGFVASFGEDSAGELYVVDINGAVSKLVLGP